MVHTRLHTLNIRTIYWQCTGTVDFVYTATMRGNGAGHHVTHSLSQSLA